MPSPPTCHFPSLLYTPFISLASSSLAFTPCLCTHRVVDTLTRGVGVGGGVTYDVAPDDGLVDVQHQTDHHLDHHRHEQVAVNPRPVVLEAPKRDVFYSVSFFNIFYILSFYFLKEE